MTDLTKIRALTICSSSKFYETAQYLANELESVGITVHVPRFDFNEEIVDVSKDDKMRITHEFLRKIDVSDAIYVIDQEGYTGRSVCIEIGYASALGKTVLASEPPAENAVQALTAEIVPVGEIARRIRP